LPFMDVREQLEGGVWKWLFEIFDPV